MQRLHIDRGRGRRRAAQAEYVRCSTLELGFPGRHLIGVDVEMLGQLGQRPIALDGGKRHLRLESRAVVPARSSVHGLSCSRRSSPLSGRNSTYRLVQISGTGSFDDLMDNLIDGTAIGFYIATPKDFREADAAKVRHTP